MRIIARYAVATAIFASILAGILWLGMDWAALPKTQLDCESGQAEYMADPFGRGSQ